MNRHIATSSLLLLLASLHLAAQPGITPVPDEQEAAAPTPSDIPESVIQKVDPSVVSIQHEKAGGTGFIISEDGYILSNGHVVQGDNDELPMEPAKSITVILNDERKYPAKVLGYSMDPDVALLKINTGFPLKPVEYADSRKAGVGQRVFAVGTPVGLRRTFTSGILSNTERTDLDTETVVFQTDAAINSGNSGGPLFDQQGRVLGINTYASRGNNNLGFTIPIHVARAMIDNLRDRGRFVRSYIPLYFTGELYEELARTLEVDQGILISYVMEGSSAEKMGLRHGDVIIEQDGEPVSARTAAELLKVDWQNTIAPAGKSFSLTVLRGKPGEREKMTFEGVLEEMPPMPAFGRHAGELPEHRYHTLGLGVEELTAIHRIVHDLPPKTEGVFIKTVRKNSVASRAGLDDRRIITRIGGKKISNLDEFRTELDKALSKTRTAIEVEVVNRKLTSITALAPDYLLKGKTIVLIAPPSQDPDIDVMRRELLARGAKILLATPGKAEIERPGLKRPLKADLSLDQVTKAEADIILFAGGPGSRNFWKSETVLEIVRAALENKEQVLAAAGPSALLPILASPDALEAKMTLPQELSGEAVRRGGNYTGKSVESDEKLVTTTGQDRDILREFLQAIVVAGMKSS